jgi:hypothetical protein
MMADATVAAAALTITDSDHDFAGRHGAGCGENPSSAEGPPHSRGIEAGSGRPHMRDLLMSIALTRR